MGISRYLAMTAAEMAAFSPPEGWRAAYMACHFSPYGTGLSNLPDTLPPGAMLILNDRTPICGHDPQRILEQLLEALERLGFEAVLLDFQRPGSPETAALCACLETGLPCPVGVSEPYAAGLSCPVFLSPVPLDTPAEAHLAPWKGREVWLDVAPEAAVVTVTAQGSRLEPQHLPPEGEALYDGGLCCRYRIVTAPEEIRFQIWRDQAQLEALTEKSANLGATRFVGLYQELGTGYRIGE